MKQVNVCHGWSCTLMTKCRLSDFNYIQEAGTWSHHFQSPHTDDACELFEPLHVARTRAWGIGAETED